ncbi:hypothetical protein C1645_777529 [Glomus cerebriforme]|uniref:TLDc domain-containing protein n=1 Tax=Glomus cerebriforme TaxID=658196 RepID=A0A397STJ7_9GLOM|nr:hypothetical protein C1645_777529 [Glomus cerebriforme]
MEQNFDLIYQTSFENDNFLKLQKFCTDLISKEPNKIFNSPNFPTIPEKLLVSLIKNENVQMSEVQVWEHVIKWGLAQNPELPSNIGKYSKDDFNALKITLQQCIPFIRFHNLTSKEFSDKVIPYKRILPKELYKSLIRDFLNNNNKPIKPIEKSEHGVTKNIIEINSDSNIITLQHAEIISKWINKLQIVDNLMSSCRFKLLYRESHDTFTGFKKFHEICDNQSRTVTVIKTKNNDEIFGGYNPISWKSSGNYSITKDSFIFSFKNNGNILSRVMNERVAIYNSLIYGPYFGKGDLLLFKGFTGQLGMSCKKTSYENPIREIEGEYYVKEFEIFQIVSD